MVVNKRAKSLLVDLGLSDYEAQAYMGLIGCQPASAYELAKTSGIPSAKIYETVKRLVEKGLAQPAADSKGRGQRYIALGAGDFVRSKRREVERKTAELEPVLSALSEQVEADFIWQLADDNSVYDKALELVEAAEETILVSLWPDELEILAGALEDAQARGVRIALVHYGPPQRRIGATFHHPAEETIYRERGGRGLTLVADGGGVVIATFFDDGRVEGAWSRNRAFVIVAEDYVRHDVYITKVTATLDAELKDCFGEDYRRLRDVFTPVD